MPKNFIGGKGLEEIEKKPPVVKGYSISTITILKQIHKTSELIKNLTESKFSASSEPKRDRITILLHPMAQLYTNPKPQKIVEQLKNYYFRALRDVGIEIDRRTVNKLLNPILRDFLEKIFIIAEKSDVETPRCYRKLYENLYF